MKIVLTIAGSDPSAGAGIQQDLKVATRLGCYGTTVVTALTTQNTMGVQDVMAVPGGTVESQLRSVLEDLRPDAIKIGQVPNREVMQVIAKELRGLQVPIVLDPVMISTSGRRLMDEECVELMKQGLFGLCTVVTPNLPETEQLTGRQISTPEDIETAGLELCKTYGCNFLIKGGHGEGCKSVDVLFTTEEESYEFESERLKTRNLHGTGCALSTAIACGLAEGESVPDAVYEAVEFVHDAIASAVDLHIGHGNGPINVWD